MKVRSGGIYIKENKDRITNKIKKRQYKPLPVKRVQIPKENGQKRNLGIPTVMDRIIQQGLKVNAEKSKCREK